MVLGVGLVREVVITPGEFRHLELLQRRRLVVLVGPADREALKVAVALEVVPRQSLFLPAGDAGEDHVDEAEGDLDAGRDLRPAGTLGAAAGARGVAGRDVER